MPAFEKHLITAKPWRTKLTILIGGGYEDHYNAFVARRVHKKEARELAQWLQDEHKVLDGVCITPNTRPGAMFIYFSTKPNPLNPDKVDTIVHELMHATFEIMRRVNVTGKAASEEAYAHTLGQLTCEVWQRLFSQYKLVPKGAPGDGITAEAGSAGSTETSEQVVESGSQP